MAYNYPNQSGGMGGYAPPGQQAPPQGYYPGSARPPQNNAWQGTPTGDPHQNAWHGGAPTGVPPGVDPNIYNWFVAVDQDRSGRISARELKLALLNGNWSTFTEEACRMMISLFDRAKVGSIDAVEFQGLWTYLQQWRGVFERYDTDRSGTIEHNELTQAVSEMGYRLTPQFFSAIISKYDPKTKSRISLDDFITFSVQLQLYTNAFRGRDVNKTGVIQIGYEDFLGVIFLTKP